MRASFIAVALVAVAVLVWPGRRTSLRLNERSLSARSDTSLGTAVDAGAAFDAGAACDAAVDAGAAVDARTGVDARTTKDPAAGELGTDDVASCMVLLAVALQSGCGIVEGVELTAAVAAEPGAGELRLVATALRWGVADDQAWAAIDPRWSNAAAALRLAAASGVAPSSLLLAGAEDLRAAQLAATEVAGAKVGVRMVLPLGLAFLPGFVLTTVVPLVVALAGQVLSG